MLFVVVMVVFLIVALAPGGAAVSAQGSLTLTAPEATLGNGDDFATTILGDPWDMDKLQDIGWEENVSSTSVADGIWSGRVTVTNPDAGESGYVFPLFQGFPTAWPVGKIGANYPIDTSRYTQLSYRMYVSDRSGGNHAVYGTHEVDWPDGSNFFARADTTPNEWKIYSFDMRAQNGDPGHQEGSWQGAPVYGLRIDPNPASTDDYDLKVDWVRLTDPSTSPPYKITWDFGGLADTTPVQVFVDTDRQGYDGDAVATVLAGQGRYDLPTTILPGGDYYLYLRSGNTFSNYGERLRINNPPVLRWDLTAMGQDYATAELGNPWDMSDRTDLANLADVFLNDPELYGLRQFYDWTFEDGVFSATADSSYADRYSSLGQSDVQLWPAIDPDRPVDANRYRYLVIRMKVDDPLGRTRPALVQDGWIGRVVWWNQDIGVDGFVTDEVVYHKGWNTYVIDLEARDQPAGFVPEWQVRPWRTVGTVEHMRYDPLEVSTDTRFHVDDIRLLSEPSADELLQLYLGVGDPDGQTPSLTYFYDTDRAGFDGRRLTSASAMSAEGEAIQPQQAGAVRIHLPLVSNGGAPRLTPLPEGNDVSLREVSLLTAALPEGTYYVYACASDGIAETCHYLPVPVSVGHR